MSFHVSCGYSGASYKCSVCRASAARGGGAAALPGLRVAARARAGVGAARRGQRGRRARRRRAAQRLAGAPGRCSAALHGAVCRQRQQDPPSTHCNAPAADGHYAR